MNDLSTPSVPPTKEFCGTGTDLRNQLAQQDDQIAKAQQQMRNARASEDSLARQVPRLLYESLQSGTHQRALTRLQWERHLASCRQCTLADITAGENKQNAAA